MQMSWNYMMICVLICKSITIYSVCEPSSCQYNNQTGFCLSPPAPNYIKAGVQGCRGGCYHRCLCYVQDIHCKLKPCSDYASCIPPCGSPIPVCQCNVGYAGNGQECGPDQDMDGYPDTDLQCCSAGRGNDPRCCRDNCPNKPNSGQEDTDNDGVGDACDSSPGTKTAPKGCSKTKKKKKTGWLFSNLFSKDEANDGAKDCDNDIDKDGIDWKVDNCPDVSNVDQKDTDGDKVGDACDNCPNKHNAHQTDKDQDMVGDACDNNVDGDRDGVQDDRDNCRYTPNSDQLDSDADGKGNACDNDADGDGILNNKDNCPLVANPNQDDNDPCLGDLDGDGIGNCEDTCPNNFHISKTNFSIFKQVDLNKPRNKDHKRAHWIILNNGKEISEKLNSNPSIMYGIDVVDNINYEGTFYVGKTKDDDWVGIVFSYQSNKRFYLVQFRAKIQKSWLSIRIDNDSPGLSIKRINSKTGYGLALENALMNANSVSGQTKLLWNDPSKVWQQMVSYRWQLLHRPSIGLIRLRVLKGKSLFADSGNVFDDELKGGRLGVYVHSQEKATFSSLEYKCKDKIPQYVWDKLSPSHKKLVEVDLSGHF